MSLQVVASIVDDILVLSNIPPNDVGNRSGPRIAGFVAKTSCWNF